jgi:mRNA interferase HigB
VRIIARSTLKRFAESRRGAPDHAAVEAALSAWVVALENHSFPTPQALKSVFRNASVVGADRVVFNIKGNDYRLIVAVDWLRQIVYIKWVGSHADYDRIDVRTVRHGD